MNRAEGLLLDVEGTLVGDKRYLAIPGAVGFIAEVRARGLPVRLITNNTTDPRPVLVEKLAAAGFDFTLEEVHTCIAAAASYLRGMKARRCLVLGTTALGRMFTEEGFELAEDSRVDAVVVGLDTGLTYERLRLACDAIAGHGAAFVALHRNRTYPDAQGRVAPSVGPIVEAVRYATMVEPVVVGKPSPDYFREALDQLGVAAESVAVVSDDPFTDLAGAKRMGMLAVFVLSGKYPNAEVLEGIEPGERPDVTVDAIGDLLGTALLGG
jgi:4-nitrophenyl phosphatase